MSEEKALALGYTPKAYLRFSSFVLCVCALWIMHINMLVLDMPYLHRSHPPPPPHPPTHTHTHSHTHTLTHTHSHTHTHTGTSCMCLRTLKTSFFSGELSSSSSSSPRASPLPPLSPATYCSTVLCSPAYATPRLLDRAGLALTDIDVFEYHEAFAVGCRDLCA